MYINVNFSQFYEAFRDMGRLDNFTYQGLEALFEFLEDMERDTGEQYELDVIALCCDFSQDSYQDVANNFGIEGEDADELKDNVIEFLEENTSVVYQGEDSVIYQVF